MRDSVTAALISPSGSVLMAVMVLLCSCGGRAGPRDIVVTGTLYQTLAASCPTGGCSIIDNTPEQPFRVAPGGAPVDPFAGNGYSPATNVTFGVGAGWTLCTPMHLPANSTISGSGPGRDGNSRFRMDSSCFEYGVAPPQAPPSLSTANGTISASVRAFVSFGLANGNETQPGPEAGPLTLSNAGFVIAPAQIPAGVDYWSYWVGTGYTNSEGWCGAASASVASVTVTSLASCPGGNFNVANASGAGIVPGLKTLPSNIANLSGDGTSSTLTFSLATPSKLAAGMFALALNTGQDAAFGHVCKITSVSSNTAGSCVMSDGTVGANVAVKTGQLLVFANLQAQGVKVQRLGIECSHIPYSSGYHNMLVQEHSGIEQSLITGCEAGGAVYQGFSAQNSYASDLEVLPGVWGNPVGIASLTSTGNNIAVLTVNQGLLPAPAAGYVVVISGTGLSADNGTFIVCDSTVGGCANPSGNTFSIMRSDGVFYAGTVVRGTAVYPSNGVVTAQQFSGSISSTVASFNTIGTFTGSWFPPPWVGAEVKVFGTANYDNDGFNSANRWFVCGPPMAGCSTPTNNKFNFWMVGGSVKPAEGSAVAFATPYIGFMVASVSTFRGLIGASIVNKNSGYIPAAGVLVSGLPAPRLTGDGLFVGIHTEWVGAACYAQSASPHFENCNGSINDPALLGGTNATIPTIIYVDPGSTAVALTDITVNSGGFTGVILACAPDSVILAKDRISSRTCGG